MNYRLVYTRRAEKDIKKLDPAIKKSIGKSLLKLRDNPVQYSEKLTDPRIGTYRFRAGDYRVIYLYLDESGGLGFDFFAKKPSRCFTVLKKHM